MTGADIVVRLLLDSPDVIALVPAASIRLGRLGENAALPALLVRTVSSVEHQTLRRGAFVRVTDRVSVTVRAASYRDQVAAIGAVRACCAGRTGDLASGLRVSILTAGTGPDLSGPGDTFEQAQDFRVSFDAAA